MFFWFLGTEFWFLEPDFLILEPNFEILKFRFPKNTDFLKTLEFV